jgi:hypothetical protein
MALLQLLGLFDTVCIIIFVLTQFFSIPDKALYIIGAYLIIKGVLFTVMSKDIASIIDLICGLYALSIVLGFFNPIITLIVILYLAQKVVFSFIRLKAL